MTRIRLFRLPSSLNILLGLRQIAIMKHLCSYSLSFFIFLPTTLAAACTPNTYFEYILECK